MDAQSYGKLQMRRVSTPGGTPTISANLSITVPTTGAPISVPHLGNSLGTNAKLDALDDRLFAAHIRNGKLWTAHSIQVNSSGVYSSSGGRDGSRWYELSVPVGSGTPTLTESGTVFDPAATNPRSYWIPSVMVSGQGHAAFALSSAGNSDRANSATVGRLVGDAFGTTQTVALYTSSSTAYNVSDGYATRGSHRWGDYSYVSLDPIDDQTMWAVHMFCDATNSYGVRVAKLIAPPPATPNALPDVTAGQNPVNVTLTGVSTSGSGFWDPGANLSGVPAFNHLAVSITNGSATGTPPSVVSATFVNATTVNLVLNALSATANIGTEKYTLTATNPDGQTAAAAVVHVVAGAVAGACCDPSTGGCTLTAQAACASPSVWHSDWTTCSPNPCPQPGACCDPSNGVCTLVLETACTSPLTWNGAASCTPNPCPQSGACCNPSTGVCTLVLETACTSPLSWNSAASCTPSPCPQLGGCCTTVGACSLTLDADCSAPSVWHSEWITCSPNPCPQPAACCLIDGSCAILMESGCSAQQGLWIGSNPACDPDPCPTSAVSPLSLGSGEGLIGATPNPFLAATTLWYRLAGSSRVRLEVFDANGSRLSSLDLGEIGAGIHWVKWDGRGLGGSSTVSSGVCFARLTAGDRSWTRMIIRIQ